jgi:hypothetical protein
MAIALGAQAINSTPGSSATTHTAALTFSSGDLVVVCTASRDNVAVTSVGDSVNGAASYTRAGAAGYDASTGWYAEIWYFENSGSGAATITVTWASGVRAGINAQRWTGAATSSALDQNNENTNASGTSHPHGSITTTGAGLMITSLNTAGGFTSHTPEGTFTALTGNGAQGYDRSAYAYRIVTGSTTDENTHTTGSAVTSQGKIASFNEPAAGGSSPPQGSHGINRGFNPHRVARLGGLLE